MQVVQQHVGNVFPEVIGTALDVGKNRIEVHQRISIDAGEVGHVVALECIRQQESVTVDLEIRFVTLVIVSADTLPMSDIGFDNPWILGAILITTYTLFTVGAERSY